MKKTIGLTLSACLLAAGCGSGSSARTGEFALVPNAAHGFEEAKGTAELGPTDSGTAVRITLEGLVPDADYMTHVHEKACSDSDPGGPHYKFDPDGSDKPPNEIHLKFRSKSDGTGSAEVNNPNTTDDRARSVVVHAPASVMDDKENKPGGHSHAAKVLCADLS